MVRVTPVKKGDSILSESGLIYFALGIICGVLFFGDALDETYRLDTSSSSLFEVEHEYSNASPKVNSENINGTPVLWARPTDPDAELEGILFVAHGCGHSHTDWFQDCEGCLGLPEERAIVEMALDNGLLVVATSSSDRTTKCWNAANDLQAVGEVLQEFNKRYQTKEQSQMKNQQSLPMYAFGASSGGIFVSSIATQMKEIYGLSIRGYISQVAAQKTDMAATCHVFITMNRDVTTESKARSLLKDLNKNIDNLSDEEAARHRTRHIQIPQLPVVGTFFASRIPEISVQESTAMTQALHEANILYPDGLLMQDPRQSNWRNALSMIVPPSKDSLKADQSPISEALNVAYGKHEISRDGFHEGLLFCMNKKPPLKNKPRKRKDKKKKQGLRRSHTKWYEEPWDSWPQEVQNAATSLGYTRKTWDANKDPDGLANKWSGLNETQRWAAKQMGYTAKTWNADT